MKSLWTLGLAALASVSLVGCGVDQPNMEAPDVQPNKDDMKKAMDDMQQRMSEAAQKGGKGFEKVDTNKVIEDAAKPGVEENK